MENKTYIKLIHMVWSGTTKYLRQACQGQNKPVEFSGLGVFMPRNINPEKARLTADTLGKVEEGNEIIMIANQKFLDDNGLYIGNKNDILISQDEAEQHYGSDLQSMQKINYLSIAKVCNTDATTVELVLKEIVAQISKFVK